MLIPANGVPLGKYVDMATVEKMLHETSAAVCIIRRSMAAEVAGGQDFKKQTGAEHLGDKEFFEGIREDSFTPEVKAALIGLANNHCLAQLVMAGKILYFKEQAAAAACGMCVPTPDANSTAS